jgi:hypothetical protein
MRRIAPKSNMAWPSRRTGVSIEIAPTSVSTRPPDARSSSAAAAATGERAHGQVIRQRAARHEDSRFLAEQRRELAFERSHGAAARVFVEFGRRRGEPRQQLCVFRRRQRHAVAGEVDAIIGRPARVGALRQRKCRAAGDRGSHTCLDKSAASNRVHAGSPKVIS